MDVRRDRSAPDSDDQGAAGHPLSSLVLNARTYAALRRHGVDTVEQLAQLDEPELRGMRQVGAKMVAEIQAALDACPSLQGLSQAPALTAPRRRIPRLWQEWSLPAWLAEDYAPLGALDLGQRAHGALHRAGLSTVRQVALLAMQELAGTRSVGRRTIEDIRRGLVGYAFELSRQPTPPPPDPEPLSKPAVPVHPVEQRLSFAETMSLWLESLAPRAREVVTRRLGLDGEPRQTLEELGQAQGITRERVRQIESKAFRQLVQLGKPRILSPHSQAIRRFLADKDGLASAEEIVRELGLYVYLGGFGALLSSLILAEALADLKWLPGLELLCGMAASRSQVLLARRELRGLLAEGTNSLALSQLPLACAASRSFQEHCQERSEGFLLACLRTDPDVTIADGVVFWPERASRFASRLVSALRDLGVPTHYTQITIKANEGLPEEEQAAERNVHALLQRCTDLFVRVDSGTYGLVEWGRRGDDSLASCMYDLLDTAGQPLAVDEIVARLAGSQPTTSRAVRAVLPTDRRFRHVGRDTFGLTTWTRGVLETLADVAARVLADAGQPLALRELTDRVLAIRSGARSSMAAVMAKDARFTRISSGMYALAEWAGESGAAIDGANRYLENVGAPMPVDQIPGLFPTGRSTAVDVALARDSRLRLSGQTGYALVESPEKARTTVAESIFQVLSSVGRPLSIGEIEEQIATIRPTRRSGLYAPLAKDPRFCRISTGLYGLVPLESPAQPGESATVEDAVYQVLQQAATPLSPRQILERAKAVCPTTHGRLHGLLATDPRFQRFGASQFGLTEWGFTVQAESPTTISDEAYKVLRQAGGPLAVQEILRRVTDVRAATLSTLCSQLGKDERFVRISKGVYALRDSADHAALWRIG